MAATDVYASYTRIPTTAGPSGPGKPNEMETVLSNSDATSAPFKLLGGWYQIDVIGATFGTVTLQKLGPDGSTYITAATAFSASGSAPVQLGYGTYKFTLG